MRRGDIYNTVMSFVGVMSANVDDSMPGNVVIRVTAERFRSDGEIYNLRINIMETLERTRPAGVGFDVQVARTGDAFPVRNVAVRSRFEAIAEELTADIAPLKKPAQGTVPAQSVPQLFEQIIWFAYGKPTPCPKCNTSAFEPNSRGDRVICRGCPLPAPVFPAEYADSDGCTTRRYKCNRCARDSAVTLEISEVNLYCSNCGSLSLHSLQWETKRLPSGVLSRPVEFISSERATRVFSGAKATFKFNGVEIKGFADLSIEEDGDIELVGGTDSIKEQLADRLKEPPGGWPSPDWAQAVAQLSQQVSSEYGLTYEQMAERYVEEREQTPAGQLAELFRIKLGLRSWRDFEEEQRRRNTQLLEGRDWSRRTGRTTRGLVYAIAEYMVNGDLRYLAVVGSSARYTQDLAREAYRMYENLNCSRRMDIKPLMPNDFDPRYDYSKTQRAQIFVDHSYEERRR